MSRIETIGRQSVVSGPRGLRGFSDMGGNGLGADRVSEFQGLDPEEINLLIIQRANQAIGEGFDGQQELSPATVLIEKPRVRSNGRQAEAIQQAVEDVLVRDEAGNVIPQTTMNRVVDAGMEGLIAVAERAAPVVADATEGIRNTAKEAVVYVRESVQAWGEAGRTMADRIGDWVKDQQLMAGVRGSRTVQGLIAGIDPLVQTADKAREKARKLYRKARDSYPFLREAELTLALSFKRARDMDTQDLLASMAGVVPAGISLASIVPPGHVLELSAEEIERRKETFDAVVIAGGAATALLAKDNRLKVAGLAVAGLGILRSCGEKVEQPSEVARSAMIESLSSGTDEANNAGAGGTGQAADMVDSRTEVEEVIFPKEEQENANSYLQELLEKRRVDVREVFIMGQTYDDETSQVLTENNTADFGFQRISILTTLNEALVSGNSKLPEGGSLWLTVGSDEDSKPVLLGQYYAPDGTIAALVCPGFDEEVYQIIFSNEPNNANITLLYRRGEIIASDGDIESVRLAEGWTGKPNAIGGPVIDIKTYDQIFPEGEYQIWHDWQDRCFPELPLPLDTRLADPDEIIYHVQSGDTLLGIASKLGILPDLVLDSYENLVGEGFDARNLQSGTELRLLVSNQIEKPGLQYAEYGENVPIYDFSRITDFEELKEILQKDLYPRIINKEAQPGQRGIEIYLPRSEFDLLQEEGLSPSAG